jgi:hypothetical protein
MKVKVKVKLSLDKPGLVPRAPGGWSSQNFYTTGTWKSQGCLPYAPATSPPPPPVDTPGIRFCYRLSQPQSHNAARKVKPAQ